MTEFDYRTLLEFSPDHSLLAVIGADNRLRIWSTSTSELVSECRDEKLLSDRLYSLSWGEVSAASGLLTTSATTEQRHQSSPNSAASTVVAPSKSSSSSSSNMVLALGSRKSIWIWDYRSGSTLARVSVAEGHGGLGPVRHCVFLGDSLLSAAADEHIVEWSLKRDKSLGKMRRRFTSRDVAAGIYRLAVSPCQQLLVSGGSPVSLWSLDSSLDTKNAWVTTLAGHTSRNVDVRFDSSGRWLASFDSSERSVLLWSMQRKPAGKNKNKFELIHNAPIFTLTSGRFTPLTISWPSAGAADDKAAPAFSSSRTHDDADASPLVLLASAESCCITWSIDANRVKEALQNKSATNKSRKSLRTQKSTTESAALPASRILEFVNDNDQHQETEQQQQPPPQIVMSAALVGAENNALVALGQDIPLFSVVPAVFSSSIAPSTDTPSSDDRKKRKKSSLSSAPSSPVSATIGGEASVVRVPLSRSALEQQQKQRLTSLLVPKASSSRSSSVNNAVIGSAASKRVVPAVPSSATVLGPASVAPQEVPAAGLTNANLAHIIASVNAEAAVAKDKAIHGSSSASAQPQANSIHSQLASALGTADEKALDAVLVSGADDKKLLSATVARLHPRLVLPLLRELTARLFKKPSRADKLSCWFNQLFVHHATYLAATPAAAADLFSFYRCIDARMANFKALLRLAGRLDLILAQAETSATVQPVHSESNVTIFDADMADGEEDEEEEEEDGDEDKEEGDEMEDEGKQNTKKRRVGGIGEDEEATGGSEDDSGSYGESSESSAPHDSDSSSSGSYESE